MQKRAHWPCPDFPGLSRRDGATRASDFNVTRNAVHGFVLLGLSLVRRAEKVNFAWPLNRYRRYYVGEPTLLERPRFITLACRWVLLVDRRRRWSRLIETRASRINSARSDTRCGPRTFRSFPLVRLSANKRVRISAARVAQVFPIISISFLITRKTMRLFSPGAYVLVLVSDFLLVKLVRFRTFFFWNNKI